MAAKKSPRLGRFHDTQAAQYLRDRIDELFPMTQREIALKAGFPAENVLSMIKHGELKLPLERVDGLAAALGVAPHHLMRMALAQYVGDKRQAIDHAFASYVSIEEGQYVQAIRKEFEPAPVRASSVLLDKIAAVVRDHITR